MTIHNISACNWHCLTFQSVEVPLKQHLCYLYCTSSSHPAVSEEEGKGKSTQLPGLLVQKAAAVQPLDWVCGVSPDEAPVHYGFLCIAAGDLC